jgi:gamma-glutamyltranspeptidase/glutathione hydrolase
VDGFTTRPELAGSLGMVATTHWLASQTGMAVLERGGNAADAAVAAGFVLQVVEPHLNGPGGEVPILVAEPSGRASVVCGQGVAPRAATPQAFAALGLDAVPGTGLLAATVPGAFGAWTVLLQTWGTWTLRQVLEPAIALARDGAPVLPRVSATLSAMAEHFRASWPSSARTYLDGAGSAPQPWSRLRLPQLAATYERLLAEAEAASPQREAQLEAARAAWYRGFVAEAIDRFCRQTAWPDTSGRRHGGLLTGDDLAAWEPPVEEPLRRAYRDVEVLKAGFWSQGPSLLQQLQLLAELLPDADPLELDDPAWVHALVEAQKLAFADREAWYGDPDAADVPAATLLSREYARERSLLVDPARADLDLRPGSPDRRPPRLPSLAEYDEQGRRLGAAATRRSADDDGLEAGVGEPTVRGDGLARGDTCHIDVVDAAGLQVSATPSGAWLQSSPVVPDLGFPLGTRAQMFRLEPDLPATLRPGTRPRTTLSPTLLFRDGRPWAALGTPGGDQQDQWTLLLVLRLVHGRSPHRPAPLQAALDAPMLSTEHAPGSFYPRAAHPGRVVMEDRWPQAVRDDLAGRGHDVQTVGPWALGRLSVVTDERRTVAGDDGPGWLRAGADARGSQGYAVGR